MEVINANPKLAGIDLEKILTPAALLRPEAAQRCVQKQVPPSRSGLCAPVFALMPTLQDACSTGLLPTAVTHMRAQNKIGITRVKAMGTVPCCTRQTHVEQTTHAECPWRTNAHHHAAAARRTTAWRRAWTCS